MRLKKYIIARGCVKINYWVVSLSAYKTNVKYLKGTVKEKWKGVYDETWESQALNNTYKISVSIMWQWYCTAIGWSSSDVIRTIWSICNNIINYIYGKYKIKKKYIGSKLEILRLLWDIVVFRLVAYLNMIYLILQHWYKITYIWIKLTQFYIYFSGLS